MESNTNFDIISKTEQQKLIVKAWLSDHIDMDLLFACAICHSATNASHPIHCPECSKIFCANCIEKWFNTGRTASSANLKGCPCCQAKVTLTQFTYCRVYQEVHELIEGLYDNVHQLLDLLTKIVKVCEEHNKELLLFCEKCSKCVCLKCILSGQHRSHIVDVLELDDAHERLKATITKENSFLNARLAALVRAAIRIASRERHINKDHRILLNELSVAIETMFDKIQDDRDERIKQHLMPVKDVTMQQKKDVEMIIQRSFDLSVAEASADVVMKTVQMIDAIKKLHCEPLPVLQLPSTGFINPVSPPPVELHFSMRCFSKRILQSCLVFSVPECIEGFLLQLKGHHDVDEDMIKLSLRIVDGYDVNNIKVICYPTQGGEPLVRRLDLRKDEDNTVLEFSDFPSMGGFLGARSDELHVQMKFNLWATYYDKCAHKDWYIKKLAKSKRNMIE